MLKKKDETIVTVPVAPVATKEKTIEFGFEHELKEAEINIKNNDLNNINSALIKTYGNKTFKLNPYKDLNPVSIENANIQLSDSNEFLSGEVKAKVLDETLNDRSNLIKTPLIGDIIVDYEADKEGCQKRYDFTIELLKNENNKNYNSTVDYEELQGSPDEFTIMDVVEDKSAVEEMPELEDKSTEEIIAENLPEQRNELENKITDFDEVQTFIQNDIEFSPRVEDTNSIVDIDIDLENLVQEQEEVIDIRFPLEKASVNYYIFDKFKEVTQELETKEEIAIEEVAEIIEPIETFEDIGKVLELASVKYYEELEIKVEEERQRALKEALRREQEKIEDQIVEDILNSLDEGLKVEEAKKQAEEYDLRIPSNVYILEVQNFIPLPEEPTPEMKAQMSRNLIDIEDHLEELPLIVFRDSDEEQVVDTHKDATAYEEVLETTEEPEYYSAPIQDFNMYDAIGSVEEASSLADDFSVISEDTSFDRTRNNELSYEDIEEAFFNIKTINESVDEVEQEANNLGLNNSFDSGISLAKAAKIEALVEKKKAERKILLAEERLQAELEKQQIEERIRAIQDKINLVKQMNLSDFESEEVEVQETVKPQIVNVESVKVEEEHQDQGQEQEIIQETTRRRGRPAGSKNKKTLLKEARERRKLEKLGLTEMPVVPKKRGRPLGSKNKKRKSK